MGSSFPVPFYNALFAQYQKVSGNTIIDNGSDSESGIRSLRDQTINFLETKVILSEQDKAGFKSEILSIPICLSAIVLAYNIPGVYDLKLNSSLITDIYLQNITYWNDPAIKAVNPDIDLPSLKITVIHRSDESGSSSIFSDYLCKTDAQWKEKMGRGKSLNWHSSIGINGSISASATIRQREGSIGYIVTEYASMFDLPTASIRNASGNYVKAGRESIRIAAETGYPEITNSLAEEAYPLSCFSWFLVYKNQAETHRSEKKYKILKDFLLFAVSPEQQKLSETMSYIPLPDAVLEKAKKQIELMEWRKNGE